MGAVMCMERAEESLRLEVVVAASCGEVEEDVEESCDDEDSGEELAPSVLPGSVLEWSAGLSAPSLTQ